MVFVIHYILGPLGQVPDVIYAPLFIFKSNII